MQMLHVVHRRCLWVRHRLQLLWYDDQWLYQSHWHPRPLHDLHHILILSFQREQTEMIDWLLLQQIIYDLHWYHRCILLVVLRQAPWPYHIPMHSDQMVHPSWLLWRYERDLSFCRCHFDHFLHDSQRLSMSQLLYLQKLMYEYLSISR